jgi:hypothetical protein
VPAAEHRAVTQHTTQQRRQTLIRFVLLFWASELFLQRLSAIQRTPLLSLPAQIHDPWVAHTDHSRHLHSAVPGRSALHGPSARHQPALVVLARSSIALRTTAAEQKHASCEIHLLTTPVLVRLRCNCTRDQLNILFRTQWPLLVPEQHNSPPQIQTIHVTLGC